MRVTVNDQVNIDIQEEFRPGKTKTLRFQIMEMFPFNSDRKRMGIIVWEERLLDRGEDRGALGRYDEAPEVGAKSTPIFFLKGADNIMMPRLKKSTPGLDKIQAAINGYAKLGLRTLVIACKKVKNYQEFADKYHHLKNTDMYSSEEAAQEMDKLMNAHFSPQS